MPLFVSALGITAVYILSLHDALPICPDAPCRLRRARCRPTSPATCGEPRGSDHRRGEGARRIRGLLVRAGRVGRARAIRSPDPLGTAVAVEPRARPPWRFSGPDEEPV